MSNFDNMEITLEPHPAVEHDRHGNQFHVISDQQQILVNGVRAGYCGAGPGQAINFIRRYPEEFKQAVVKHVQEKLGGESKVFEPPPSASTKKSKKK